MQRREFLKIGAGCAITGITTRNASGATAADARPAGAIGAGFCEAGAAAKGAAAPANPGNSSTEPLVITTATAEDHRRRLRNIAECERGIRVCLRRHLITEYLPGQVVYNLGEYPCRRPWDPDDWDEKQLDELAAADVELVQLHEEWNDSLRLFGADKFSPLNEEGFRRFIRMVHDRGMKVIVYASTGFFPRNDPDFRPEWARAPDLEELYWRYARCSPASAGWRAYVLPRLMRIMDVYGVDGLYDDLGYVPLRAIPSPATGDEVVAFEESETHDGALEDLLSIVYAEVKRRGGIVKVHASANNRPRTNLKVYDYLWVGESVRSADQMRQAVRNHPPYVVPCLDMSRAKIDREDDLYLHSIPYMQFPILLAGRPFTGERGSIPGIDYPPEEKCFWTRHCGRIWRHYRAHPDGPFTYGWWDSCPGRPEARPTYYRWLKLYRPMTEPGTRAYLELTDSDFFEEPLPEQVVASAFANRELYLALANYGPAEVGVETAGRFVSCTAPGSAPRRSWSLPARTLTILKHAPA